MSDIDTSTPFGTVSVERLIAAPPQRIWEVIGTADGMQRWLNLHHYQPRLDGRILLDTSGASEAQRIIVFGRITRYEPGQEVVFTWAQLTSDRQVWPVDTEVALSLQPRGDDTLVRFVHSGFDRLAEEQARKAYTVYHHCWVECGYLGYLEELSGAEA